MPRPIWPWLAHNTQVEEDGIDQISQHCPHHHHHHHHHCHHYPHPHHNPYHDHDHDHVFLAIHYLESNPGKVFHVFFVANEITFSRWNGIVLKNKELLF